MPEAALNAIVDMLERYLSPPGGGNSEAGKVVIREMLSQFEAMIDQLEQM